MYLSMPLKQVARANWRKPVGALKTTNVRKGEGMGYGTGRGRKAVVQSIINTGVHLHARYDYRSLLDFSSQYLQR